MPASTLLKTLVGYFLSVDDHPRLLIVQQYQFSHPIPATGPVFTGTRVIHDTACTHCGSVFRRRDSSKLAGL